MRQSIGLLLLRMGSWVLGFKSVTTTVSVEDGKSLKVVGVQLGKHHFSESTLANEMDSGMEKRDLH